MRVPVAIWVSWRCPVRLRVHLPVCFFGLTFLFSSGIGQTLPHVLRGTNGRNMALYGDLGYGSIGEHLYTGFKPARTEEQRQYNSRMSAFRIAIEHGFCGING